MREQGEAPPGGASSRVRVSVSRLRRAVGLGLIRALDIAVALALALVLLPLVAVLAAAVKIESPGPALYRSRRIGLKGRLFVMLKFRKMPDGAAGPLLTAPKDERFTRLGRFLAKTKLDELPQLWNVLRGDMSLVGPRPEDPAFVDRFRVEIEPVLQVKPGITGLSQLAFAREPEILDPDNREEHYVERILPQKIHLDCLYATQRSVGENLRILWWTAAAVLLRQDVAVHRTTGQLGVRRRPSPKPAPAVSAEHVPVPELASVPELAPVHAEQPGA